MAKTEVTQQTYSWAFGNFLHSHSRAQKTRRGLSILLPASLEIAGDQRKQTESTEICQRRHSTRPKMQSTDASSGKTKMEVAPVIEAVRVERPSWNWILSVLLFFGGARSLWLGHAVQWLFYQQPWPPWLVVFALLTVLALVVHPEGYTWTLARGVR